MTTGTNGDGVWSSSPPPPPPLSWRVVVPQLSVRSCPDEVYLCPFGLVVFNCCIEHTADQGLSQRLPGGRGSTLRRAKKSCWFAPPSLPQSTLDKLFSPKRGQSVGGRGGSGGKNVILTGPPPGGGVGSAVRITLLPIGKS